MQISSRPAISVVISTYQPRLELLNWTLDALRRQTLKKTDFEVVIVDNGSRPALQAAAFSGDESLALRVIQERRRGLIYARIAGAAEARAGIVVFADDDNALDPDYLEQALRIAAEEPSIGCFGGIARPVWDDPPAEWKQPLLGYLGVRDYGALPITSWKNHWGEWEPIGAGMVCRRAVTEAFGEWVRCAPPAARLGRRGRELMSGEDTLMAMSAYKLGYACSYQPALKLSHWIKSPRLRIGALRRLLEGHGRSFAVLQRLRGQPAARESVRTLWRKYRLRVAQEGYRGGTMKWFWDRGYHLEANRRRFFAEEMEWRAAWFASLEREIEERDRRILDLTQAATRRLEALHEVSVEAQRRDQGSQEIAAVARERLELLEKANAALAEITAEAERRERDAHEAAAAAQERLALLEKADAALKEITAEAEKRERGMIELTAEIAVRDRRIAELERMLERMAAPGR